jgi:enoyl-CoA hydratase/carnithine racemase
MPDIHVRERQNILWLILDRPPLNTLTAAALSQLTTAMHKAAQQPPRLVVITGMGERAFCAGVDLPDNSESNRTELVHAADTTCQAIEELRRHAIPTVAIVKGSTFGAGCELVALCDTVIAREDAEFRLPPVNGRVFVKAVSTYLPALIGQEATTRLMQSGATLSAREAMRMGLAHQVLPASRFVLDIEELLVMLATSA